MTETMSSSPRYDTWFQRASEAFRAVRADGAAAGEAPSSDVRAAAAIRLAPLIAACCVAVEG
jgi:hypothetical protein